MSLISKFVEKNLTNEMKGRIRDTLKKELFKSIVSESHDIEQKIAAGLRNKGISNDTVKVVMLVIELEMNKYINSKR